MQNKKSADNVVFIGNKPFMNYISAVILAFKNNNKEVTIKARGKFMSRAIDVAEAIRKRILESDNIKLKDIKIDSEKMENKDKREIFVSTMEITLIK